MESSVQQNIAENLSKKVNKFFADWIKTTPLEYKAKSLCNFIKRHKELEKKYSVIDEVLYWMDEECGYDACREAHYTWVILILFKLRQYKGIPIVKDAYEKTFNYVKYALSTHTGKPYSINNLLSIATSIDA